MVFKTLSTPELIV